MDELTKSDAAIQLDSCAPFERIVVKTHASEYEVTVLSAQTGEVLIRGGRFFPELRRVILVGSRVGRGRTLNTIDVGLRMELCDDMVLYTTSPVEAVSRVTLPPRGDAVARSHR
jgi:hypothetical protein